MTQILVAVSTLKNRTTWSPPLFPHVDHSADPLQSIYIANMSDEQAVNRQRLLKESLTDDEADLLYDIMDITDQILSKHNIEYILEGGSLLGHYRCNGLLEHDNDGDFDVLESDLDKIRALKGEFAKFHLEIIETPGWGLQISYESSPELAAGMWTDGMRSWTSKWPFLDLIAVTFEGNRYVLAGDVARHDYPNYYLTREDWEQPKSRVQFGHLSLWTIGNEERREAYLDRHYPDHRTHISMVMDHRSNLYFDQPIKVSMEKSDRQCRMRSNKPSVLEITVKNLEEMHNE